MSNPPTNNADKSNRPDEAKPAQHQQGQSDKVQQQGGPAAAPTQPADPAPVTKN